MEFLFWFSLLGAGYSYALYPLVLLTLPKRPVAVPDRLTDEQLPRMSLIITVHNEAGRIDEKLENALALDYPPDRLEILVASDASSDDTETRVQTHADRGVRLVRSAERNGKEYAQSLAIAEAGGEILVFTDAGTHLPDDSLRSLARNFADPRVGAVSSEDRFVSQDGRIAGEGAYVRYEMWLRRLEAQVRSLVGLSGSFFAVRRELTTPWDHSVPSDFNCALNCARQGLVAVSDPQVVGIYRDIADSSREYARKRRTILRGMNAIARCPEVLDPRRLGLFAFMVWSHKMMRWAVPWFLLLLLGSSLALTLTGRDGLYSAALLAQLLGYCVVVGAGLVPGLRRWAPIRLGYFFVEVNLATLDAALRFLSGQRALVWEPSRR